MVRPGRDRGDGEAVLAGVPDRKLDAPRAWSTYLAAGPGELAAHVERYRKAGVHVFVSDMAHTPDRDRVRLAGSVLEPLVSAARPREEGPPLGRPLPPH